MRSATELRRNFAKADKQTQKQMIVDLYGTYDAKVHNIMANKITEAIVTLPVNDELRITKPGDPKYGHLVFGGNKGVAVKAYKRLNHVIDGLKALDAQEPLDRETKHYILQQIAVIREKLNTIQSESRMYKAWNILKEEEAISLDNPEFNAIKNLDSEKMMAIVKDTITDPREYKVLMARFFHGKTIAQVAEMIGRGQAQTRMIESKALRRLKLKLRSFKKSFDENVKRPDFNLTDLHPSLRPLVRQAMVKFPMAKDKISAVVRMLQQDMERTKGVNKEIGRLDTTNDVQDVEIDSTEVDVNDLEARVDKLEKSQFESRLYNKWNAIKEGAGSIGTTVGKPATPVKPKTPPTPAAPKPATPVKPKTPPAPAPTPKAPVPTAPAQPQGKPAPAPAPNTSSSPNKSQPTPVDPKADKSRYSPFSQNFQQKDIPGKNLSGQTLYGSSRG
jgi:hypothetical protein